MNSLINTSLPDFVAPKLIHCVEGKYVCLDEEKFYASNELPVGSVVAFRTGDYSIRGRQKNDVRKLDNGKNYVVENLWFDNSLFAYAEFIRKAREKEFRFVLRLRKNEEGLRKVSKNYDGELCSLEVVFCATENIATLHCWEYWITEIIPQPLHDGCFDFAPLLKKYYNYIEPKRSVLIAVDALTNAAELDSCKCCKDVKGVHNEKLTHNNEVFNVGKGQRFVFRSGTEAELIETVEHMKKIGGKVLRYSPFDKRFEVAYDLLLVSDRGEMSAKSTIYVPKIRHNELLRICLALAPLGLAPYVMLEIVDWLTYIWAHPHKRKIDLIFGVQRSVVKLVEKRAERNKKPHTTE